MYGTTSNGVSEPYPDLIAISVDGTSWETVAEGTWELSDGWKIAQFDKAVTAKYVIIATRYPIINFPGFHFIKMYSEASYLIGIETSSSVNSGVTFKTS